MSWFDDNVRFQVSVSTTKSPLNPRVPFNIPIQPGGPNGAPSGWIVQEVFPSQPTRPGRLGGMVMDGTAYFQYIGETPIPPEVSGDNISEGQSGAYYVYRITNFIVGHRYMLIADVGSTADRFQSSALEMRISPHRANGVSVNGVSNSDYGMVFPDAETHTIAVAMTTGVAADVAYIDLRFYSKGSLVIGQPDNRNGWTVKATNISLIDLDATPAGGATINWRAVDCDVQNLTTRYGRNRFTERYDVGTFNMVLTNVSGDYAYQPNHPTNWGPGRLLRVTATVNGGTVYPVCFGVIRSISMDMEKDGTATATIQAFDTTSILSEVNTPSIRTTYLALGGQQYHSGKRINDLLDYAGIPTNLRNIDVGAWGTNYINESSRSIREEVGVTADSEGGAFFADRSGIIQYRNRNNVRNDPFTTSVQANITAVPNDVLYNDQPDAFPTIQWANRICPFDIEPEWSDERVINQIKLANAEGTAQTFSNTTSQAEYGIKTYQRLDYVLYGTKPTIATFLNQRAADFFAYSLTSDMRVVKLSIRPTSVAMYMWAFRAWLNWAVRVFYYNPKGDWGFSTVVKIQSIEHRITPTDWTMTLAVDQSTDWNAVIKLDSGGWDRDDWDSGNWDSP